MISTWGGQEGLALVSVLFGWLGGSLAGLAAVWGSGCRCVEVDAGCSVRWRGTPVVYRLSARSRTWKSPVGVTWWGCLKKRDEWVSLVLPSSARLRREFLAALLHSVLPRCRQANGKTYIRDPQMRLCL